MAHTSVVLTALQRRASAEGVDPQELENAVDGETPNLSIIALIVAKKQAESIGGDAAMQPGRCQ